MTGKNFPAVKYFRHAISQGDENLITDIMAGVKTVTDVLQKMNQINTAVSNGVNNVQTLDTRSQEIGKIVALITDISEQTYLP